MKVGIGFEGISLCESGFLASETDEICRFCIGRRRRDLKHASEHNERQHSSAAESEQNWTSEERSASRYNSLRSETMVSSSLSQAPCCLWTADPLSSLLSGSLARWLGQWPPSGRYGQTLGCVA